MSRGVVIGLAAALVALVLLLTLGQRGGSSSAAGDVFMAGLEDSIGDIERVAIVKANGEAVATLERRPDRWVAVDRNEYAADASKLRQALTELAQARILEQKTANADLYSRLGVEDVTGADATGISVAFTAAGKDLPTVILGNVEGSKYRYVRRAGEAQSFLIDRNPDFPRTTAQWLDSQIVNIDSERVREVTITHPDGEVVRLSKTGPELTNFEVADIPSGRELLYPGVANVVGGALRELNLEDVQPAPAAPVERPTVVEVRTFDGLVVRVTGTKADDESWITLQASVDAAAAAQPASTDTAATPAEAGAAPATPPADPNAEAAAINSKVGGWRYKIAGFQYDQMTRRMSDLLKAPPAA
jgi:hypothetical protein